MSAVSNLFGGGSGGTLRALFDPADLAGTGAAEQAGLSAEAQERALQAAIEEQRRASEQGLGFLQPFGEVGQRGIDLSGFLADPNAQFNFLQNNPLFQMGLDNLNQQTQSSAAARGRLSSGDTLQQLTNNSLLAAQPLIDRQRQDIGNLLNLGTGIAQSQANTALGTGSNVSNLLTDIGAVQAGGIAGASNARSQGANNLLQLGGTIFGASDPKLKQNIEKVGVKNDYDIFTWDWNEKAGEVFGLFGSSKGVMVPDVLEKNPEAVEYINGFGVVNYSAIGIEQGA